MCLLARAAASISGRWLCELRDHGAYGTEAQFWEHEEFRYSRRFDTRALAVQWAEAERKAIGG
jgi:hypothetical protein